MLTDLPCEHSYSASRQRHACDMVVGRRLRAFLAALFLAHLFLSNLSSGAADAAASSPYPPSPVIESITWHWETHRTAALGSDLWPITWAADGHLYAAWGDGGGFDGTDQDGRVSLGFARIEGIADHFIAANVNGGKNSENPPSFPRSGKTGGILSVGGMFYAWINRQNGPWPDVDQGLAWSNDRAATWQNSFWVFPRGKDNFKPSTFLNFGKNYSGVPPRLKGFIYFYGIRQGHDTEVYTGRVPIDKIQDRAAYQFLCGLPDQQPVWSTDLARWHPVFADPRGTGDLATVVYHPALKRFLLTTFHKGPGQLGIFDAPQPWGPWTTVAYYEDWGSMGTEGEGLTCSFPSKWMSAHGLTLWCVFSVYGDGARRGIHAHDRFNVVKATLKLRARRLDSP